MFQNGMKTFTIIWFGQFVSLVGTAMTRFALLIWAYQQTHNATTVALLGFFSFVPFILASPIAGVWVDRLDRRLVMMFTDLGAGMMTIGMLGLYVTGNLQIWHLFIAAALTGAFEAFQMPAYSAATTMLIPKKSYARASGMRSLATSGSQIAGPFLAGALLAVVGIGGVMAIDIVTFLVAMVTLLIVRIPAPLPNAGASAEGSPFWHEIGVGFHYIRQRRGLMGLLLIFTGINFFASLTYFAVLPVLILARTGGDELALASVQAALGIGGVAGGLLLSMWGGPKRQIHGVLAAAAVSFWVGDFLFAIGRTVPVWITGAFMASFFVPFIVGANRAIWQAKVAPDLQGRVFSLQSALRTASMPLGYLMAGPLADTVFEPAMAAGGPLTNTFGWLVGIGPGAGVGLMFACTAVLGTAVSLSGYLFSAVRCVEVELPDHDTGRPGDFPHPVNDHSSLPHTP
jgi:MFS family permease